MTQQDSPLPVHLSRIAARGFSRLFLQSSLWALPSPTQTLPSSPRFPDSGYLRETSSSPSLLTPLTFFNCRTYLPAPTCLPPTHTTAHAHPSSSCCVSTCCQEVLRLGVCGNKGGLGVSGHNGDPGTTQAWPGNTNWNGLKCGLGRPPLPAEMVSVPRRAFVIVNVMMSTLLLSGLRVLATPAPP
ncbi:hypothetical protein E2C01_040768 [Portunus trituberculatus]|uniref:Uncharacterized protein n=1 Tax=Portunus trituberculatus TaxID=210409 RepID=A0A5B7FPN1_PORTR|nr:hypothetical protein [Portunus trituberculatus]